MKKVILVVIVLFGLPLVTNAVEEEDTYNSIEYLENDFNQASLVALIHPVSLSPDNNVKAIGNVYRTKSRVIKSFKGNAKVGDLIEFFIFFEGEPNDFYRVKDRIVFLKKDRDEEHDRWVLTEMENSSREASKSNLEKIRKISRGSRKRGPINR